MSAYKAGIIGCGRPSVEADANKQGFSIAYSHGNAYSSNDKIQMVAAADISIENATAYVEHFDIAAKYTDYKEMIDRESLDIVSICTWPTLHKEMTIYAAKAGVKMIWCEKPMAVGLDEVDEMLRVCEQYGARLFINHQRRFEKPFQAARRMIDDGALGPIERLEAWVGDGWDLMSWGTHWVDMHRFFMHDEPVEWVVAQAPHSGTIRYGHPVEDHMLLQFQFSNGVVSIIHLGSHVSGAGIRVIGKEGSVSLNGGEDFCIQHKDFRQDLYETYMENAPGHDGMSAALNDLLTSYEEKRSGEIDAANGAKTTEIVLAAYLSSVLRKKLSIPLESRDFNLLMHYK